MLPPWLLSAALRGALVSGLALLALVPLRRASAPLRHGVLALALTTLALLPLASSLLPAWRVGVGPWPEAVSGFVVDESTRPLAGAPAASERLAPVAPAIAAADEQAPVRARGAFLSRGRALALAWAAGALLCLARLASAQAKARAIVRRARPVDGGPWADDVERAARRAETRPPRVLVSDEVRGPAVAGLARPVLLLPPAALAWGRATREAVLLHELAHLRRGDLWTNLLAGFVKALHWFDPLVWALARRLHHERELSADAFALRAGVRPSSYAESLLAVAASGRGHGALLAMAQRPLLSRRIEAALGPRAGAAAAPLARLASFALGAPLAVVLACASPDAPPGSRAAGVSIAPRATGAPVASPPAARPEPRAEAIARELGVGAGRVELTIERALQDAAEGEIARLAALHGNEAALGVVIMTPSDGAVVALASRSPRAGEEVAVERSYVPGSTMKLVTLAAAFEEGTLRAGDRVRYGGGEHGLAELVATSSNEGTGVIFRRLGADALTRWQRRFHFGERPAADALPFAGAAAGALPAEGDERSGVGLAAIGAGLSASPVQIAAAYAAIANGGVYNAPSIVRRVRDEGGRVTWEHRPSGERLLRPETARDLLALLGAVVESPRGTGKAARVEGVRVGGKTGTVDVDDSAGERGPYASFVGVAPLDAPRYVIAIGIEGVRGSGGELAAPSFGRLAARVLAGEGPR